LRSFIAAILLCAGTIIPQVGQTAPANKTLRIGVLYWSMNIPGQVAMRKGLEAEAERINAVAKQQGQPALTLIPQVAGDGSAGVENQIAQMFAMVKQKPDIIIVQPTDNAALAEPLRAANQAGIPVVAYDQYISGGTLAAYITSNNHQAGYLGGYCAICGQDQHQTHPGGVPACFIHSRAAQWLSRCPARPWTGLSDTQDLRSG
jgi:ribose transport system substrate-binding protein